MKFIATIKESIRNLISAFIINEKRKKRLPLQLLNVLPTRKKKLRKFHAYKNIRKKAMTLLKIV